MTTESPLAKFMFYTANAQPTPPEPIICCNNPAHLRVETECDQGGDRLAQLAAERDAALAKHADLHRFVFRPQAEQLTAALTKAAWLKLRLDPNNKHSVEIAAKAAYEAAYDGFPWGSWAMAPREVQAAWRTFIEAALTALSGRKS